MPSETVSAELFLMSMADRIEAALVIGGATAVVPLADAIEESPFDMTHISVVPHAYIQIKFAPGNIMTYGTVICYSLDATSHSLNIGSMVKFPTPQVLFIAKGDLLLSIEQFKKGVNDEVAIATLKRTRSCLQVVDG